MKIIAIGDIHGQDVWKKIIKQEKTFDKVIFLGDYFDSFYNDGVTQLSNYNDIRDFRDSNKDKVITLLGNHEYHYIVPEEKYSGWKHSTNIIAKDILMEDFNLNKLKYIYKYKSLVFSHAGISKYWLKEVAKTSLRSLQKNEVQLKYFSFNMLKGYDPYGNTISNSPIWIRPYALSKNKLDKYTFIIGHTATKSGGVEIKDGTSIIMCDCLPNEYLVIENHKDNYEFHCKKIKDNIPLQL